MKWKISLALMTLLAVVAMDVTAQTRRNKLGRHYREIFPQPPQYAASYWYFAPGVTYMFPMLNATNKTLLDDGTSKYQANINPKGGYWLYLEFGRYKVIKKRGFFKYFDYGIAYKGLGGKESFTGELVDSQDMLMASNSGTNNFRDHFLTGHFNLNHVWEISDFHFIQNSLGINGDYAFNRTFQSELAVEGVTLNQPGNILGQLHYKLGFGFKPNSRMLVILGVETPVVGFYPVGTDILHMEYFNSTYRPLIFSLRFMPILPWREKNCAPVKTRDGPIVPTDMLHTK